MLVAPSGTTIRRKLSFVLKLCFLLCLTSCGKDKRPPLVPVEGQVFLENIPAHKAIIWFHAVEPVEPGMPRPHAVVDKDGNFVVGTFNSSDGAPPGKYRVAIYWTNPGEIGDEDGENLIPLRYMDPETSGLPVVEIEEGPVTLPAFRLTRD
jgi:hypothetical protein